MTAFIVNAHAVPASLWQYGEDIVRPKSKFMKGGPKTIGFSVAI
jgi:hypothetical protein